MGKTKVTVDKENLQIFTERTLNAPVDLVYKAFTDKDLMSKWWGPANLTTIVEKMDVAEGGEWRITHREQNGNQYAFHGVYKEVVPNQKIIWTFNFDPIGPGHESVETVTFEEVDGKTNVKTTSKYNSIADLEGMVSSGMEEGMNESYGRLDELLEDLNK